MTKIDFKNIRGGNAEGKRAEFEKLVVLLALRDKPGDGWEFRPLDGRGGDGGVEAYWQRSDGTGKIGYQAKYFTRSGDIDWSQIDKSVRTALDTHPELTRYVIALPCDLTGKSGKKSMGQSGWGHWEKRKKKWKGWASAKGMTVTFDVWHETELRDRCLGMEAGWIWYWFDALVFDKAWFDRHITHVKSVLSGRYRPDIHAERDVSRDFDVFGRRSDDFKERLIEVRDKLSQQITYAVSGLDEDKLGALWVNERQKLENELTKLRELPLWDKRSSKRWNVEQWKSAIQNIGSRSVKMARILVPEGGGRNLSTGEERAARQLSSSTGELSYIFEKETSLQLINSKVLFVSGEAGIGKSHALANFVESEIADGRPVLMLLGQHFVNDLPSNQIPKLLNFPDLGLEAILEGLDVASEASGKCGLVIIDALNEGKGQSIWPDHITNLVSMVSSFNHLKLLISCRTPYERRIIEAIDASDIDYQKITMAGLNESERREFCNTISNDTALTIPPHLAEYPIMRNPLFLLSWLESGGQEQFPSDITGAQSLLDHYVDLICNRIRKEAKLRDSITDADLKRAYKSLAKLIVKEDDLDIRKDDFENHLVKQLNGSPAEGRRWLDLFLDVGAMRLDETHGGFPSDKTDKRDEITVHYTFNAFEDFLIAEAIYQRSTGWFWRMSNCLRLWRLCPPLELFWADRSDGVSSTGIRGYFERLLNWRPILQVNYLWKGVATALWVILAEREKIELFDLVRRCLRPNFRGGWPSYEDIFEESLAWRSPKSILDRTRQLLNKTDSPHLIALQFLAIPNHPFNAKSLHQNLSKVPSMAIRDSFWTTRIANDMSLDAKEDDYWSICFNQLNRKIVANADNDLVETYRLSTIAMAWFCTSSNREIRDKATKKIAEIFLHYPQIMPGLINQFSDVNDLYVIERVLAAAYGACCWIEGENACYVADAAVAVYQSIFEGGEPPLHLLVRDYGQGIVERAAYLKVLPSEIDIGKCRPPFKSPWPLKQYSNTEIDELADAAGDRTILHSCVTEYGRGTSRYGDFGRYTLESAVNDFIPFRLSRQPPSSDWKNSWGLNRLRFSGQMIGNWVAHRAYTYGWTSERFPHERTSRDMSSQRLGRERIGKKYQWIAMMELLGILADNVYLKKYSRTDWREITRTYTRAHDLQFQRDIEATIISSQSPTEIEGLASSEMVLSVDFGSSEDHDELRKWPYLVNQMSAIPHVVIEDSDGQRWYRLHAFTNHDRLLSEGGWSLGGGRRQTIMGRLSAICIEKANLEAFLEVMQGTEMFGSYQKFRHLSPSEPISKTPEEFVDNFFWGEYFWAFQEPNIIWNEGWERDIGCRYFMPVKRIYWESHLDKSLTYGSEIYAPPAHLCNQMGLKTDRNSQNLLIDKMGNPAFYSWPPRDAEEGYSTDIGVHKRSADSQMIRADIFDAYLDQNDLTCVWVLGAEREYYHGEHGALDTRNLNSLAWFGDGELEDINWAGDSSNSAGEHS